MKFVRLLSIIPLLLAAQNSALRHITINDGLSQNYIFASLQDSKGFLWFGTKDGLNRYDGYSFKIYRKDNADSFSLHDNTVTAIAEDGEHTLWIGTGTGGLLKFDRLLERFQRYTHDPNNSNSISSNRINKVKRLRSGSILISTSDGGLNLFNERTGRWKHFDSGNDTSGLSGTAHINEATEDKAGNIWVSSGKVVVIDSSGAIRTLHYPEEPGFFRRSGGLLCDSRGRMWIADRNGLVMYDGTALRTIYKATEENQWFWTTAIREDSKGDLWSVTAHALIHINGTTLSAAEKASFPVERLSNSLLIDRSDNIWIGTGGWGLILYNPRTEAFGRQEGNFLKELLPSEFSAPEQFAGQWMVDYTLRGNEFRLPFRDSRGITYIPSTGGMVYRIMPDGRITAHDLVTGKTDSRSTYSAFSVFEDRRGTVWVNRNDLLVRFNGERVLRDTMVLYPRTGEFRTTIGYSEISAHYVGRDGRFWFGTPLFGLMEFNPGTQERRFYSFREHDTTSLSHNHVLCITEDPYEPERYLWIGTDGGGLNKFDLRTGTFSSIAERQGFPNNTVYAIVPDDEKKFWISTNKGLVQFDPRDGTMRLFDVHDGLQSNEFNRKEFYKTRDGKIYLGGVGGYNAFYPRDIRMNSTVPTAVITDLRLFNRRITYKSDPDILTSNITFADHITLQYSDNVVTFEFAGLEYSAPAKNQYRYTLEGFDEHWIANGTSRTATFTNIDPGTYTFRVSASNGDGIWNEQDASIVVTVLPPFWRTWWFLTLISILFLSTGPIIYYRRVTGLKQEQRRQQEISRLLIESQESERKRIAQEMHDSLGQELLVIKNRAVMGLKTAANESKEKRQLEQISEGATSILKMVRTLSHNLRPPELDRLGLTETIRSMLTNVREASGMTLNAEVDEIDGLVKKESEINLIRILQEALSNIEKHSGASVIDIRISVQEGRIMLTVKDNGKGYTAEHVTRGIGLAGISERVRILEGSLSVESGSGSGTAITITIPAVKRS
jgi:signal transduction histidine kinase/ligand-binding sensor domain-containing protein